MQFSSSVCARATSVGQRAPCRFRGCWWELHTSPWLANDTVLPKNSPWKAESLWDSSSTAQHDPILCSAPKLVRWMWSSGLQTKQSALRVTSKWQCALCLEKYQSQIITHINHKSLKWALLKPYLYSWVLIKQIYFGSTRPWDLQLFFFFEMSFLITTDLTYYYDN